MEAESVAAYAPAASQESAALEELLHDWEAARARWKSPLEWLTALAQSGNGITVDYSPVQELDVSAASLDQAVRAAYRHVQRVHGTDVLPQPLEGEIEIVQVGDWK